jgi:hypothetical protein
VTVAARSRRAAAWALGALLVAVALLLALTLRGARSSRERAAPDLIETSKRQAPSSDGPAAPAKLAEEVPPWEVKPGAAPALPPGTVPAWQVDPPPPDRLTPRPPPQEPPNPALHRPAMQSPSAP